MNRTRHEDAAEIDRFIATKGVTKCPPAAAAPVEGGLAENAELREHGEALERDRLNAKDRRNHRPVAKAPPAETISSKPLRHSGAKAIPSPAIDPGPKPEMAWLPIDSFVIDRDYQRALQDTRTRRLGREFKWVNFQPLTVSPISTGPAGKRRFAVIDGQHRFEAACLAKVPEVPCYIVPPGEPAQQAQAFVDINRGRVPVTAFDIYRAALVARHPWALNLRRVLAAAGVEAVGSQGSPRPMQTKAVAAIRRAMERHGEQALRRTLSVIAAAWGGQPNAFIERAVIAHSRMFYLHPDIGDAAVTRFLRSHTPASFAFKVWERADALGCEPAEALAALVAGHARGNT